MENKPIARTFRLFSQLLELHDENKFKVRGIANAAFKIDKLPYSISQKSLPEMEQIEGIGKSTASRIWELLQTGTIAEMESLISKTPPGVLEIMSIKGIGPKKVKSIWTELAIETVGELYYACNENRLIEAKGFGLKTQDEIKKAIDFRMASKGRFLWAHIEKFASTLFGELEKLFPAGNLSFTGEYRRKCEIVNSLDFLVISAAADLTAKTANLELLTLTASDEEKTVLEAENGLIVNIYFTTATSYGTELIRRTGSEEHITTLLSRLNNAIPEAKSEEEIYEKAKLPFIEPELREGSSEFKLAEDQQLPKLIEYQDLKGTLHNHSDWSDGVHTLEQMALYCRDELQLQYLGISDHSKSAFYAKGLSEERVLAQMEEINRLNGKLAPFKIFKGIESDILFDGSLDYAPEILSLFDFVVASVHSILKMTEEKATERLITAIENPYTTILGHPTGRLLLSRNGYPVNFKKVIDACAANGVVIEINANPLRLDMDWRWHQYAIEKNVLLSINPDAHRNEGFSDMKYGVGVARKGGVQAENCLNSFNLGQIIAYLDQQKAKISK